MELGNHNYPSQAAGQIRSSTVPEPVKVFVIGYNSEDGRGSETIIAVHENKRDAERNKGDWHTVSERLGLIFNGPEGKAVYLIQGEAAFPVGVDVIQAKRKLGERALAKLSAAEQEALKRAWGVK